VDPKAEYTRGRERALRELGELEGKTRLIALARLAVAGLVIALVAAIAWAHWPGAAWLGVVSLVGAFVALVLVHARVHDRKDRAAAAVRFHERGLARLDGAWTKLPGDGARFEDEKHPYASDLDLFGRASLFQRIDATETRFGEELLARWLREPLLDRFPDALRERQAAVRELAGKLDWRERLSVAGAVLGAERPDARPFLAWAEGAPPPFGAPVRALAKLLPVCTVGLFVAGRFDAVHVWAWLAPLAVGIALSAAHRARLAALTAAASSREGQLARFAEMLALVEGEPFESPLAKRMQADLHATGASATREMAALGRVVGFLDARNNEVFRFFIAPVLLWDLNCAIALGAWASRAGKRARRWLEVIAEAEALASLAGLAFDHPSWGMPELSTEPRFEAKGLGHPLIADARRVANDVTLAGRGRALVVTGSNMSGKTTLLRAVGADAVLALAGTVACAESLVIGPLQVATSMRVRDSIEEGVSRFYAELRRLKQVLDLAKEERAVLFLLDEIMHGTNTRERLIGAREVVRTLVARGAMGAVSTHDLGLGGLESELEGRVVNVHFQEQVTGDEMTFDYKLRPGLVQSSNALRLMKMVGLDVAHEA
jgi:hypothetical protein